MILSVEGHDQTVVDILKLIGPGNAFIVIILIIFSTLIYHYFKLLKFNAELNNSNSKTDIILGLIKTQNRNIEKMITPLEVLTKGYESSISKEQIKLIVEVKFAKSKFEICRKMNDIIVKNNIVVNKTQIDNDISLFIQNRFDDDVEFMFSFKFEKIRLSTYMDINWKINLSTNIKDIVFNPYIITSIHFCIRQ